MKKHNRLLLSVLILAVVALSCNLPVDVQPELFTPAPTKAVDFTVTPPSPTVTAAVPAPLPTLTRPAYTITAVPSLTALPPTVLVELSTATETLPPATATATATATSAKAPTSGRTPTAPPTLTAAPNATKTNSPPVSGRVVIQAVAFQSPPVLDGIWDEWKDSGIEYPMNTVTYGGANWSGVDDLSGSLRAGWDDNYLYLAAKIRDDVYVQNATGNNLYLGDSLEILLDANLSGDLRSRSLSTDDYQLGISPGRPDVQGKREAYLWFPRSAAGARTQIKIAAVREDNITRIEAAIPWSVFHLSPFGGARYGFTLSFSDNDDPNANTQQSMISSAPGRVLVDPTTWGELRLK